MDLRPNWTPDGRSVVFERVEGRDRRLYRVPLGGGAAEPLDLCNLPGTNTTGRAAFFGQDDFAFVSDRSGVEAIWRCRLATRSVTPLTTEDAACYGPAAVVGVTDRLWFFKIKDDACHVRLLRGATSSRLTRQPGLQDQPWPRLQGDSFVFHAEREGRHEVRLSVTDDVTRSVCLSDGDERTSYVTPFPSPDGRWVAFSSARNGASQVVVTRVDGTGRQQVTSGAPHCFPAWRADGRALVVVQGDPNGEPPTGNLWVIGVRAGGEVT
ncbi:TolB family protein [Deinococcus pimensis]|uniref:TolB family protein n=1 Tax=Deinococcus pimensis TaxID=309888 RepID=UPI000694D8CE|nr:PD40 domain-containing protein [Deinococcus pimensis]